MVWQQKHRSECPFSLFSGRMALLVTLFLVLVNIFNSVTANAPKAEGLTAVETWVVSCIIHVFGVLAEYALILKMIMVGDNQSWQQTLTKFSHCPLPSPC